MNLQPTRGRAGSRNIAAHQATVTRTMVSTESRDLAVNSAMAQAKAGVACLASSAATGDEADEGAISTFCAEGEETDSVEG